MFQEFENRAKTTPILMTHLDSPLRCITLERVLASLKGSPIKLQKSDVRLCDSLNALQQHYPLDLNYVEVGFSTIQSRIFTHLGELMGIHRLALGKELKKFFQLAWNNLRLQETPLEKLGATLPSHLNDTPPSQMETYWRAKQILEAGSALTATGDSRCKGLTRYGWTSLGNNWYEFSIPGLSTIWVSKEATVWKEWGRAGLYMGTRDHYLGLADLASQRFMLMLSASFSSAIEDSLWLNCDQLHSIYNWGDRILQEQGNSGYDSLALWESLIVSYILNMTPDPYVATDLYVNAIKTAFQDIQHQNTQHYKSLFSFLDSLRLTDINLLFQAYGLFRIWGHPTVNAVEGVIKVREVACKPRFTNFRKTELITNKFKEYTCISYRLKNSVWPKLDTSQLLSGSYLKKCIQKNLVLDTKHSGYKLSDWGWVKGLKTFPISKQYELSEIISDKATSLGLTKLIHELLNGRGIGPSAERSVLLQWIMSDSLDPEEFLNKIDAEGFPAEECVVGVYPKEREMKLKARLFGLLTIVKRMYVVLTEAIIAEHFLPLFSEITMMDDQAQLLGRHFRSTRNMSDYGKKSPYVTIVVNSDFSKWNSNMREEETAGCFSFMDELLGFKNCIRRTHEMFKDSQLYLADGSILPEVVKTRQGFKLKESLSVWSGHLGGIEGLRQKGWTIWTACILRYIIELTGVKAQIMGQGDNQVIICSYPKTLPPENIKVQHQRFITVLENFISDFGPPLKRDETWESSQLFLYGKYPIYKGTPRPMSCKKVCRMMKMSNEGFPTIESCLSSLSANFFDSSWMARSPLVCFLCYSFETANALDFHLSGSLLSTSNYLTSVMSNPQFKIPTGIDSGQYVQHFTLPLNLRKELETTNRTSLIQLLLIFPRILGGYPITLLGDLIIRGFPDPLTSALSQLKHIHERSVTLHLSPIFNQFLLSLGSPTYNPWKNYEMLGMDPVSVNLLHPSTPAEQLKHRVLDLIKSSTIKKSKTFLAFLNKIPKDQKPLAEYLCSMQPVVNPRIIHEILDATVAGRAKRLLGRIQKTNTMVNLMIKNEEGDVVASMCKSEVNYTAGVLFNLTHINPRLGSSWTISCSTKYADQLRIESWDLPISGVTAACPLEFLCVTKTRSDNCLHCPNASDGFLRLTPLQDYNEIILYNQRLGPATPFFGSVTREKVYVELGRKVSDFASPLLTRIAHLLKIINWGTDSQSSLTKLLKRLLRSVTDLPPHVLMCQQHQVSGSVEHRFLDTATKHGSHLGVLYTGSSWCTIETSTLIKYAKGSKNVNLHFQAMIIALETAFSISPYKNVFAHAHVVCGDCIQPINEAKLDLALLSNQELEILIPQYKFDPFFWISSEKLCLDQNLQPPLKQFQSPDLTIASGYQPESVFSQLAAQYLFTQIRSIEVNNIYGQEAAASGLPVAWIWKLHYPTFFKTLTWLLICHSLFNLTLCNDVMKTLPNIVSSMIGSLQSEWFYSFLPLTYEAKIVASLTDLGFSPPAGCPPSVISWTKSFREFLQILIPEVISSIPPTPIILVSKFPEVHGYWLNACQSYLSRHLSLDLLECIKIALSNNVISQVLGAIEGEWLLKQALLDKKISVDMYSRLNALTRQLLSVYHLVEDSPDYWAKLCPSNILSDSSQRDYSTICPSKAAKTHQFRHVKNQIEECRTYKIDRVLMITMSYDFCHLLKPTHLSTTALYKGLEIFSTIKANRMFPSQITLVGDGCGGFTIASQLVFPCSKHFFSTLIEFSSVAPQGLTGFCPPDYYHFPDLLSTVQGILESTLIKMDILEQEWISHIPLGRAGCLVSDAELGRFQYDKWAKALDNLILACRDRGYDSLIFKCYYDKKEWGYFITEKFQQHFKRTHLLRSNFSNQSQYEVYVWGINLVPGIQRLSHCQQIGNSWMFRLEGFIPEASKGIVSNFLESFGTRSMDYIRGLMFDVVNLLVDPTIDTGRLKAWLLQRGSQSSVTEFPTDVMTIGEGITKHELIRTQKTTLLKFQLLLPTYTNIRLKVEAILFGLGITIESEKDFKTWLHLVESGHAALWMGRDHKWHVALYHTLATSTKIKIIKITSILSRPAIKHLMTIIATAKVLPDLKNHLVIRNSLIYPSPRMDNSPHTYTLPYQFSSYTSTINEFLFQAKPQSGVISIKITEKDKEGNPLLHIYRVKREDILYEVSEAAID